METNTQSPARKSGKTLYIERSVSNGRDGAWTTALDLTDVDRIVVGTGPGSFAGIRSALAFAQGYALGHPCEVLGLPSPCAVAAQIVAKHPEVHSLAVVGDARGGKIWIALFERMNPIRDIFQINFEKPKGPVPMGLEGSVPTDAVVVTTDEGRIGAWLKETFGARYWGGQTPSDDGLKAFAEARPDLLVHEPLPIYLNPAVR